MSDKQDLTVRLAINITEDDSQLLTIISEDSDLPKATITRLALKHFMREYIRENDFINNYEGEFPDGLK